MIKLHCKIFGKVLRDHREKKGLSQEDVEAMIGYTRSHISKIENGKRTIKRESAEAIIKLLNIDFATDKETIDHYD